MVPDNRWDLVARRRRPRHGPARLRCAVVIPYFEQPRQLAALYAALERGAGRSRAEVVVVDDGSRSRPPAPPAALRATVLRQADLGFRAAAGRNRGGAGDGRPTCSCSSTPTPSPPPAASTPSPPGPPCCPTPSSSADDATPTSAALDDDAVSALGRPAAATRRLELPGPPWLEPTATADSADLLHADDRSYRFVISAVMACRRELFDDIGGFDATLREYGGDDWDFAARAFNNGAVLVHEPGGRRLARRARLGRARRRPGRPQRPDRPARRAYPGPRPGGLPASSTAGPRRSLSSPDTDEGSAITAAVLSVLDELVDVHVYLPDCDPTPPMFAADPRSPAGSAARTDRPAGPVPRPDEARDLAARSAVPSTRCYPAGLVGPPHRP